MAKISVIFLTFQGSKVAAPVPVIMCTFQEQGRKRKGQKEDKIPSTARTQRLPRNSIRFLFIFHWTELWHIVSHSKKEKEIMGGLWVFFFS